MKKLLIMVIALIMSASFTMSALAETVPTAAQTQILPVATVEDLVDLEISPDVFGDPTGGAKIISAVIETSETNPDAQYVNVFGYIYPVDPSAPNIEWRVLLPLVWNGRSVQLGGGANNGSIPGLTGVSSMGSIVPIDEGYIVYGDDSGHQSESSMDASFAANDEALANYTASPHKGEYRNEIYRRGILRAGTGV
ncbi:MAG: tannase/feruloyl esterase family alpha/beta hydrolase [Clostridia bacterium]|nr:tannase/feruloyl esterase family alpha/beta hydrolase [Clostridia bacterium]